MKKSLSLLIIAFAAILFANVCAAQQIAAFASLPQGTTNFFQASAMAKVLQQHTGIRARVNPLRGTALGIAAVCAKEAEFMMGAMPDMSDMYFGRGRHEGKDFTVGWIFQRLCHDRLAYRICIGTCFLDRRVGAYSPVHGNVFTDHSSDRSRGSVG